MAQKNSRNFSFVGQNIKKIRQAKHISQSDFAALFDLSRPSVGAYEEGRTEPKIETLIQISRHFNISIDVLLTRELSSKDIFSLGLLNKKLDQAHEVKPNQIQNRQAPFVSNDEKVNFLVSRKDKSYLKSLPQISAPDTAHRIDLILEQEGSKLEVDNKGIRHGNILFCSKEAKLTIEFEKLWALITADEIIVGRVSSLVKDTLKVAFDNPLHEPFELEKRAIEETYLIKGVYTSDTSQPNALESRLKAIEEKLKHI